MERRKISSQDISSLFCQSGIVTGGLPCPGGPPFFNRGARVHRQRPGSVPVTLLDR